MRIANDPFSQKGSSTEHTRAAQEQSPDGMDASFFTSMLERPTNATSA